MTAQRRFQPSDGSVFCAILLLLLAVGFVIKYIWWFVGGAVLIAVCGVVYWIAQKREEQRRLEADEAAEREFEMTRRAERQKRWTLIGDERAIYGEDRAAAMRKAADDRRIDADAEPAQGDSLVAQLATTPDELDALVREKPQAWEQTLFASILVQRAAPLQSRLRDSELGFTAPSYAQLSGRAIPSASGIHSGEPDRRDDHHRTSSGRIHGGTGVHGGVHGQGRRGR